MFFFFLNDPATTEIYTLPLHDALPISAPPEVKRLVGAGAVLPPSTSECVLPAEVATAVPMGMITMIGYGPEADFAEDRKSTRLNSSHANISYAVFCLKKKKSTS